MFTSVWITVRLASPSSFRDNKSPEGQAWETIQRYVRQFDLDTITWAGWTKPRPDADQTSEDTTTELCIIIEWKKPVASPQAFAAHEGYGVFRTALASLCSPGATPCYQAYTMERYSPYDHLGPPTVAIIDAFFPSDLSAQEASELSTRPGKLFGMNFYFGQDLCGVHQPIAMEELRGWQVTAPILGPTDRTVNGLEATPPDELTSANAQFQAVGSLPPDANIERKDAEITNTNENGNFQAKSLRFVHSWRSLHDEMEFARNEVLGLSEEEQRIDIQNGGPNHATVKVHDYFWRQLRGFGMLAWRKRYVQFHVMDYF